MKVTVGDKEYTVELTQDGGTVNGDALRWDLSEHGPGMYHVLIGGKSYRAELLKSDPREKTFTIRVNGNKYTLALRDKYDELLHTLGMDSAGSGAARDMKAPMPGLVLDVRVTEGQEVKKGDGIVVLEAMKMENVLKAATDAVVKKVHIKKGMTVDKNQVLISF